MILLSLKSFVSSRALWQRLMFNLATIKEFIGKHNRDAFLDIMIKIWSNLLKQNSTSSGSPM